MILCLQDLIGKNMRFFSYFPWVYAWEKMEIPPYPPERMGLLPSWKLLYQAKIKNSMLHFVLIFLWKRKKEEYLRASLILRGMFAMLGCAALTYLSLWIGPRVRKKLLSSLGYNSKKFFTLPSWPIWSSSTQIECGKMPGSMQCRVCGELW